MKPLAVSSLAIVFITATVFGALVLTVYPTLMFTPYLGVLFVGISAVLFIFGRRVLAMRRGESHKISATGAMNVAFFAYSAAWVACGIAGFLTGSVLAMLKNTHADYVRTSVWAAIVSAVGAIVLLVVSFLVERWCQLDDDDDSTSSGVGQGVG